MVFMVMVEMPSTTAPWARRTARARATALAIDAPGAQPQRSSRNQVPDVLPSAHRNSCKLGINTLLMVTLPGTTLTLRIPCGPWLLGSTVSFQGGAIPVVGGCAAYGGLGLTDTIDVTIR